MKIEEIKKELLQQHPDEAKLVELKKQQNDLIDQKSKLGLFAGKHKKTLQTQIDSLKIQIDSAQATINRVRKEIQDEVNAQISVIEAERKPISIKISDLEGEKAGINFELTRDR